MNRIEHDPTIVGSEPAAAVGAGSATLGDGAVWSLDLPNEDATAQLAQRLANSAAIRQALITLHGDLGSGKTTLVRHLLRALGVQGRVKSPTYALLEPYDAPATQHGSTLLAVAHLDLYRLASPREWDDSGLRDALAEVGLALIEWPERAGSALPAPDLTIHLELGALEGERRARLVALSATGQQLLEAARP